MPLLDADSTWLEGGMPRAVASAWVSRDGPLGLCGRVAALGYLLCRSAWLVVDALASGIRGEGMGCMEGTGSTGGTDTGGTWPDPVASSILVGSSSSVFGGVESDTAVARAMAGSGVVHGDDFDG